MDAGRGLDLGVELVDVRASCSSTCDSFDLVSCSTAEVEIEATCFRAGCELDFRLEADAKVGLIEVGVTLEGGPEAVLPTLRILDGDRLVQPSTRTPIYVDPETQLQLRILLNAQPGPAELKGWLYFTFDRPTTREVKVRWASRQHLGTSSLVHMPSLIVVHDGGSSGATIHNLGSSAVTITEIKVVGPEAEWTPSVDDFSLLLPEGLDVPFPLCETSSTGIVVTYSNADGSVVDLVNVRLRTAEGGRLFIPVAAE